MVKVIVNADDCGISRHVDSEIQRYIEAGLVTSTTLMTNMPDILGGANLYEKYKERISFGIHVNLTEGSPLCYSQSLLDNGYYMEDGDAVVFNEGCFDYRRLTSQMKMDIEKEVCAQVEKILDYGVMISHFDSHRHVHFRRQLIPLFCKVAQKYHIARFRRCSNAPTNGIGRAKTTIWRSLMYMHAPHLKTTDYFCGATAFFQLVTGNALQDGKTYEVMLHPGHVGKSYEEENKMVELRMAELKKAYNIEWINYNMLNS